VQLHVSAFDNAHLQVVHDILRKYLYEALWVVYSREVGGEVDTRSRMCHGGWEVWVHGVSASICISELLIVRSMVSYCVCCGNYMYMYIYIYILILYIYNAKCYTRLRIL